MQHLAWTTYKWKTALRQKKNSFVFDIFRNFMFAIAKLTIAFTFFNEEVVNFIVINFIFGVIPPTDKWSLQNPLPTQ